MIEEKNAIIESVSIDDGGRGLLSAWVILKYAFGSQGFGGYVLYLPKDFKHHGGPNLAGHFIWRVMEVAEVTNWADAKGKAVRVRAEQGRVHEIGHIIKNIWFNPEKEFEAMK